MSTSNLKIMYYYIKAVDFNIHLWNFLFFFEVLRIGTEVKRTIKCHYYPS